MTILGDLARLIPHFAVEMSGDRQLCYGGERPRRSKHERWCQGRGTAPGRHVGVMAPGPYRAPGSVPAPTGQKLPWTEGASGSRAAQYRGWRRTFGLGTSVEWPRASGAGDVR